MFSYHSVCAWLRMNPYESQTVLFGSTVYRERAIYYFSSSVSETAFEHKFRLYRFSSNLGWRCADIAELMSRKL